jgi:hypothetical protein
MSLNQERNDSILGFENGIASFCVWNKERSRSSFCLDNGM